MSKKKQDEIVTKDVTREDLVAICKEFRLSQFTSHAMRAGVADNYEEAMNLYEEIQGLGADDDKSA